MSLSSNALITVKEYKEYISVDQSDSLVNNSQIERSIDGVSKRIENYCNRKFITPSSAIEEIFDGNGFESYYVNNARINDSSTNVPILYNWNGTSWDVMDSSTYPRTYDDESGVIYLNNGQKFNTIKRYYRIDYKYGWSISDVPDNVKLACVEMVKRAILRFKKEGFKSDSVADSRITYDFIEMPDFIKDSLNTFKVVQSG